VLEHVVEPNHCVEEIHRVLKENGLVYSIHLCNKYTWADMILLSFHPLRTSSFVRKFKEICGGAVCGPGMALAWSYEYFLFEFFEHLLQEH